MDSSSPIVESADLQAAADADQPKWQPLTKVQRRVVGVLVEKAKTTPESYPLSLKAVATGSNQKSNRDPQMSVDPEDLEEVMDELRQLGVVIEIQGGGRVAKYKHAMYQWLGVDKVELAVMAELLLRGEQTLGELRGRAARMEPIADVAALRPIVCSLMDKGLVIALTPEGRGQIVTHALYREREMTDLKARHANGAATVPPSRAPESTQPVSASVPESSPAPTADITALQAEVRSLQSELEDVKQRLSRLEA